MAATPVAAFDDEVRVSCGPPVAIDGGRHDYRQRLNDPELDRLSKLQVQFHLEPALKALQTGYWTNVFSNLDFTLKHWPNYEPALRLLVDAAFTPGAPRNHRAHCYLLWGRDFAPNDPAVWSSSALYYWRKRDLEAASLMWRQALELDPASAEIQYNLGLVSFAQKDYTKAREYARAAYDAGYPLPGLRKKLESVGRW
jgi:tetratricopeptide (TPR) repeat protein